MLKSTDDGHEGHAMANNYRDFMISTSAISMRAALDRVSRIPDRDSRSWTRWLRGHQVTDTAKSLEADRQ